MADMIKFFKGLEANLPASGDNGALYVTTDEGAIYLGTGTGMKRLGDFVQVANVEALPEKAHESCLYYCVAENILAKWNGSEWKQINKQPAAEEMKTLLGLGSAAYESKDAFDVAGAASAVRTYVGDIPVDAEGKAIADSVVAYINKKTDGIATSGNLEALGARVTTAEGEIDDIQETLKVKVDSVTAGDASVTVGGTATAPTVAVKLSAAEGNAITLAEDGLKVIIPDSTKVEASETNGNIKVDGVEVKVYELPELTTSDITDFGDYKTKQEVYSAEGATNKTITKVEQDANGEVVVTYSDIAFPAATVVEDSDKNGYIKVDGAEVQVFDEVFGVDMATVNALGGISAGTNLKDKTIHEVLNALLFPYVKPTVGTPSRVPNTTSALEKGNNQTITQVSVTVTKKSAAITKVELLKGSEVIATKEGSDLPNITTSGTSVVFSGLNISVPSSSVVLKVRVTDAEGSTVTSAETAGWTFVYPYFYGVCAGDKTAATLTEADIEAMTKDIKSKGEKTYTYTTDNQKMVIAYPKAHGVLKKALDPNGFDYLGDYDRAELSITGLDGSAQTYYVYAQKAPSFVTSFAMKFQY